MLASSMLVQPCAEAVDEGEDNLILQTLAMSKHQRRASTSQVRVALVCSDQPRPQLAFCTS